jgi:hypothetical protein
MSKFHNMIHLQPNKNVAQNTKPCERNCIKAHKNYKPKKLCVLEFEITKNDLRIHNLGLYPKH